MVAMSQSFVMGRGQLEHNLRIKRGRGIRQNGDADRHAWNEHLIVDDELIQHPATYTERLIEKVISAELGDKLRILNEHYIQQRHPERVMNVRQWIDKQRYARNGEARPIVQEYIVGVGDRYSACPWKPSVDEKGNILDEHGHTIEDWDTRKRPGFKDGIKSESLASKELKRVYKEFLREFQNENPRARVICASIHADENGAVHMHVDVIWIADTKNGVGISLSKTSAMQQQYRDKRIVTKTGRTDNAQNRWRADMRKLLERICREHDIERLDMHNKQQHRSKRAYYEYADRRSEVFEEQAKALQEAQERVEKERHDISVQRDELNAIQAKCERIIEAGVQGIKKYIVREWNILRNNHHEWFDVIHAENVATSHENLKQARSLQVKIERVR